MMMFSVRDMMASLQAVVRAFAPASTVIVECSEAALNALSDTFASVLALFLKALRPCPE